MENKISVQGFRGKERIRKDEYCDIKSSRNAFIGNTLSELQINCTLTCQEDIDKLNEFLNYHKDCFIK